MAPLTRAQRRKITEEKGDQESTVDPGTLDRVLSRRRSKKTITTTTTSTTTINKNSNKKKEKKDEAVSVKEVTVQSQETAAVDESRGETVLEQTVEASSKIATVCETESIAMEQQHSNSHYSDAHSGYHSSTPPSRSSEYDTAPESASDEDDQARKKSQNEGEEMDEDKQEAKEQSDGDSNDSSSDDDENDDDDDGSSEESESGSDDSNEEESEDDDADDENLDDLLTKAKAALEKKQEEQIKLDENDENDMDKDLPKLGEGIVTDMTGLYIDRTNHMAKLKERAEIEGEPEIKDTVEPKAERLSRKQRRMEREKTAGKGWFDMEQPELTPELKRDLQLLRMRHILDRKRHYKKMGKGWDPKYFQVGTIIEGPTEFYSSRLTNKERKQTIIDELMADEESRSYYKRKFAESQARNQSGRKRAKRQIKKVH